MTMNNDVQNKTATHSTIFATAFPAPGKEREWEQSIGDLMRTSSTFPGYLGSIFLRPESSHQPHYRVYTKFDTVGNMQRWYDSVERLEKVSRLHPFEQQPAEVKQLTGFETWFTSAEDGTAATTTPPKYKMFFVVWLAVFGTVLPLIAVLKPVMVSLPSLIASAILSAISVAMMTWVVLPLLTRLFKGWLYPKG